VRRLAGKAALVTGASSGIGAATAELLAREGADVALLARGAGVGTVARRVASAGARSVELRADVTECDALETAVEQAVGQLGKLDVVVVGAAAGAFGRFDEIPPRDFDRCVEVTFLGAVNTIRAVLPQLERSGGRIVVIGSAVDAIPLTLLSPYVAAKAALQSFVDSLRSELRASGSDVAISAIRPGAVDSPFWRHLTHPDDVTPPALPPLTSYSAESVARAVVACAIEPRTTVTVGGLTMALQLGNRVARSVFEPALALATRVARSAASHDPSPNGLWAASGDGSVKGGISGRPSLLTALRLRGGRPGPLPTGDR
jgi:NAD(P)-dependent dehydrogenase (short-subunit alcohol dehydrogenase family)